VGENPTTYVELMRLAAEQNQREKVSKEEPLNQTPHSTATFNNNLRKALRSNRLRDAQNYFFQIRRWNQSLVGLSSYNILLKGYANNSEPFLAEKLFSLLQSDNLSPDAATYTELIRAYVDYPEEAQSIWDKATSSNITPGEKATECVMASFCQEGNMESAEQYFNLLSSPSSDAQSILARGYAGVQNTPKLDEVLAVIDFSKLESGYASGLVLDLMKNNLQPQLIKVLRSLIKSDIKLTWSVWSDLNEFAVDDRNKLPESNWAEVSDLSNQISYHKPSFNQHLDIIQDSIERQYENEIIFPETKAEIDETWQRDVITKADDAWNGLIRSFLKEQAEVKKNEQNTLPNYTTKTEPFIQSRKAKHPLKK